MFKIKQIIGMMCALCNELMDYKETNDNIVLRKLYGAKAFAQCPICFRIKDPNDPEWRQSVIDWYHENERCWKCSGKLAWFCNKWDRVHGEWKEADNAGHFVCTNPDCEFYGL